MEASDPNSTIRQDRSRPPIWVIARPPADATGRYRRSGSGTTMLYAVTTDGPASPPTPRATGRCPHCAAPVIARCGQVNAWHWAHRTNADCDTWTEPTTDWHRAYQRIVPADRCEVPYGAHRADLVNPDGFVLELQHSTISAEDIHARETHYGHKMLWLFDAREAYRAGRLTLRRGRNDSYVSFRWKQPRRSITHCRRRVLLDLGQGLVLSVRKIHRGPPCGGWGYLHETTTVWSWLRTGTQPVALTYPEYRARDLAEIILAVHDFLRHYSPVPDQHEADRTTRASLFPGKRPSHDVRRALQSLRRQGRCPAGLLSYSACTAQWVSDRLATIDCWCGNSHPLPIDSGCASLPASFSRPCPTRHDHDCLVTLGPFTPPYY